MKNIFIFTLLAFALTGLLAPSLMIDSFAGTENPGRDKGTKTANGCDKGKPDKNNPNCDHSVNCDYIDDEVIDANDLITYYAINGVVLTTNEANQLINDAETAAGSIPNGIIETDLELAELNLLLPYDDCSFN